MRTAVAAAALLMMSAAHAQTMPSFEPEAYCKEIRETLAMNSQFLFNACLRQERSGYDALKGRWAAVPSPIRAHCVVSSRTFAMASYFMLNTCVSQEERAGRQSDRLQFRR